MTLLDPVRFPGAIKVFAREICRNDLLSFGRLHFFFPDRFVLYDYIQVYELYACFVKAGASVRLSGIATACCPSAACTSFSPTGLWYI